MIMQESGSKVSNPLNQAIRDITLSAFNEETGEHDIQQIQYQFAKLIYAKRREWVGEVLYRITEAKKIIDMPHTAIDHLAQEIEKIRRELEPKEFE